MTTRRLIFLQWAGLLFGGALWAASLVIGYSATVVACGEAQLVHRIPNDPPQIAIVIIAGLGILAAEAAAVTVFRRTRGVSYSHDDPPLGRVRFLAIAAMAANAIFFTGMLLAELATILDVPCRQA
jgi:hypothetical protein